MCVCAAVPHYSYYSCKTPSFLLLSSLAGKLILCVDSHCLTSLLLILLSSPSACFRETKDLLESRGIRAYVFIQNDHISSGE